MHEDNEKKEREISIMTKGNQKLMVEVKEIKNTIKNIKKDYLITSKKIKESLNHSNSMSPKRNMFMIDKQNNDLNLIKDEIHDLPREKNDRQEKFSIQNVLKDLLKKNEDLVQEKDKAYADKDELYKKYYLLNNHLKEQIIEKEKTKEDMIRIIKEYSEFKEKYESLQKNFSNILDQNNEFEKIFNNIKDNCRDLNSENKRLGNDNEDLI